MSVHSTAVPTLATPPAERVRLIRTLGGVGAGAGLLFAAMTIWQHASGHGSDSGGNAGMQALFAVAMAGYVALASGLYLARVGGSSRTARVFPALLALSWLMLLAGGVLEQVAGVDPEADPLLPLGGLVQGIGLMGVGITIAVAGRWSGWRRFWAPAFAAYYVGALFIPAVVGAEPNAVTESLWALGYAGLGLALMTSQRSPASARGVGARWVGVLLLAGAVVSLAATTGSRAPTTLAPGRVVVVDPGGSANLLEHNSGISGIPTQAIHDH